MAEFISRLVMKTGFRWEEAVLDEGELAYTKQISETVGDLRQEAVWHLEDVVLLSGAQNLYDLGDLRRTLLRDTHLTPFVTIRSIQIVNLSTGGAAGTLLVGNAPFDGWWEPFGGVDQTVEVPPDSPLCLVNRQDGWPVQGTPDSSSSAGGGADAQRILAITATGGDVTYSIVVIGDLTVPTDSSSSSSG